MTPCSAASIDLTSASLVQNNLGGLGPDIGEQPRRKRGRVAPCLSVCPCLLPCLAGGEYEMRYSQERRHCLAPRHRRDRLRLRRCHRHTLAGTATLAASTLPPASLAPPSVRLHRRAAPAFLPPAQVQLARADGSYDDGTLDIAGPRGQDS